MVYAFAEIMYAQMYVYNTFVPRPSHSFPSLAVQLSGRGPGIFFHVSDVTDRANYASCKSKATSATHILEHNYSELKDSSARRLFFVALHETVGRTSHASTVSHCCHPKLIHSLS